MTLQTLSLLTLTLTHMINGASRYFISTYKAPAMDDTFKAYPIDTCVIYEIALDGFSPVNTYGQYTCNQDGSVTFTDYGTSQCGTAVATNSYTNTAAAGELNAFNCDGIDDYMVTDGCQTAAGVDATNTTCCSATDCISNSYALNVCVNYGDGTWFTTDCNATSTVTYSYSAAGCDANSRDPTPKSGAVFDECNYYETVLGIKDIYLRMNKCVLNGTRVDADTFCRSTPPSEMPTNAPSKSDEGNGVVYNYNVVSVVVLLSIVSVFFV